MPPLILLEVIIMWTKPTYENVQKLFMAIKGKVIQQLNIYLFKSPAHILSSLVSLVGLNLSV